MLWVRQASHMDCACTMSSDPLVARKGEVEAASPGESQQQCPPAEPLSSPRRDGESKIGPTFLPPQRKQGSSTAPP